MQDVLMVSVLSVAMFLGSYLSGSLPLAVSFSESRLRLVTVLGAGLLVGTALAVIIPEGVQSIYSAEYEVMGHFNEHDDLSNGIPVNQMDRFRIKAEETDNDQDLLGAKLPGKELEKQNADTEDAKSKNRPGASATANKTRNKRDVEPVNKADKKESIDVAHKDHSHHDDHSEKQSSHQHKTDVHGTVGVALVAGFVLMLLVDQLAQSGTSRVSDAESGVATVQPRYKITATIGLVVHAAADGVALGAASSSAHSGIQFIVFLAIMLHKAPASFGLVTFLLHEGLDKSRIRKHLLIFALAAPIAAIVTYLFISKSGSSEKLGSLTTTGVLLLFSAGTFLYVATVHVLPEVAAGGHHSASGHSASGFKCNELVALVIGAVTPIFLTLGHSH